MIVSTYIFLSLVPKNKKWYTTIGGKTLSVYLLHLFIIRAFKETDMYDWIDHTDNYLILFGIAFIIVYILSSNLVCRITAPLIAVSKK